MKLHEGKMVTTNWVEEIKEMSEIKLREFSETVPLELIVKKSC